MFRKAHLDNGIPVLMERIRNVRSVSLGIWVKAGSANEPEGKGGVSHFLEHMFFKGTKRRSARDIALEIDSIGGDLNAFTSKENTNYFVKVLDEHLDKGVDLLTDIFLNTKLTDEDIERERGVIIEEIRLTEDTPDDYIHDIFSASVWGSAGGLGGPVLGTKKTVRGIRKRDLSGYINKFYGVKDTVVSCAGNFEPGRLLSMLNCTLGGLRRGVTRKGPGPRGPAAFSPKLSVHEKDLSEVHLCLGLQGLPQMSPDRYAFLLLNAIFGSGVSSRLFQEIREKRGLAYSVYSFISSYHNAGLWGVYAGTGRKNVQKVLKLVFGLLSGLSGTITETDLQRAKDQLKGNVMLALESTANRMTGIARQEIYYGRHYSLREIIRSIDAVSLGKTRELAASLIKDKTPALTVLGPVGRGRLKGVQRPL